MQSCVGCKTTPVSTNCLVSEEEYPFEYKSFNDLLKKIFESSVELKKILETKVDGMGIPQHTYVTEYVQDLIVKVDALEKSLKNKTAEEKKYNINSDLVVGEKTSLQLFNILFKEISAIKNTTSSSIYKP